MKTKVTLAAPIGAKNYAPDVKLLCWAYLVTALLYMLTGAPVGYPIVILATVFAGVSIYLIKTSDDQPTVERERARASCLMLLLMLINAFYIVLSERHPELRSHDDFGDWIANRFLYLFGLGFFMPVLIERKMEDEKLGKKARTAAVFVAAACMFAAWYAVPYAKYQQHQAEQHALAVTSHEEHKAEPWYPSESVIDDTLMGVAVGLWLSVFNVEMREKPHKRLQHRNTASTNDDGASPKES